VSKKVDKQKTQVSLTELVHSFMRAWQSLFGKKPSKEQLAMFISQNSIETANRKAMWNYNIGNITHSKDNFDYWEAIDHSGGKPFLSKFRAYNSLDDGVLDYLKLLHNVYPQSFAASSGTPKDFAHSLVAKKYKYYDPSVEPQYAAGMSSLYSQYMKSDEFDKAYRSAAPEAPSDKSEEQDLFKKWLAKRKKSQSPAHSPVATAPSQNQAPRQDITSILNQYLQQISASEKKNKKLYKQYLPLNNIVIKVDANDYNNSVEFARILCAALDEELLSKSYTHSDDNNVEIECAIRGPEEACLATIQQLSQSVASSFNLATKKIGGISVKIDCIMNKKSSYNQIDFKSASTQYRKFLLKFV
jgi:hypothetical protein